MAENERFCFFELDIYTPKVKCKAFLQPGFFPSAPITNRYHKHSYAEIHVGLSGETTFTYGNEHHTLKEGQLLLFPAQHYHCCKHRTDDALTSSFLVTLNVEAPCYYSLSPAFLAAYREEMDSVFSDGNYARLPHYIGLLVTTATKSVLSASNIQHYGVLIHDFFNVQYARDIHTKDLADHLHLSLRQAERLVKEHTKHSFREELANVRLSAAKHLLETTSLSSKEICLRTGFKSCAALQKALKNDD